MGVGVISRRRKAAAALIAAGALALAACGGDDEGEQGTTATTSTSTTGAIEAGPSDSEQKAEIPKDWKTKTNRSGGFTIGVPPGWDSARAAGGQGTLLTSPDELVTISVIADRTDAALALPLEQFARRTAEALGGEVAGDSQFSDLTVGRSAPFDHTYDAVAVRGTGIPADTGVEESVLVVAIRRPDDAAFVAIVRQNAQMDSQFADKDTVKQVIRSIRSRPPA